MNEAPQILLNDLQPGELAYPIYKVRSRWSQDVGDRDPKWFTPNEGLPEGRMWNGIESFKMPREGADLDDLTTVALAHAEVLLEGEKYVKLNPSDLTATVEFIRWEVWCLDWFAHWTWDVGLDDQQVLDSFRRFVDRMQCLNDIEPDSYCLMGAEERGRWYGRTTGDQGDEQVPAPCRCPMCKQRGVVNIGH